MCVCCLVLFCFVLLLLCQLPVGFVTNVRCVVTISQWKLKCRYTHVASTLFSVFFYFLFFVGAEGKGGGGGGVIGLQLEQL